MAWTAPRTWVTSELATAALLNAHVRDNLVYLHDTYGVPPVIIHEQNMFRSRLDGSPAEAMVCIKDKAYFVYIGKTTAEITPKYVEFWVTTISAGTQVMEVGLFSTPAAPNKAAQTVTKLVATGTVDATNATGVKRNTTNFSTAIAAGTHLWAGIRTYHATTQPTVLSLSHDFEHGEVLTTAAATALTGAGPWTGAVITGATYNDVAPDLVVSLI